MKQEASASFILNSYMADLKHLVGSDLVFASNGDAILSYDEELTQERILRRLLSNPKSYFWHPEYGAGLPRYLGQTLIAGRIKGAVLAQMMLEQGVKQSPAPVITVSLPYNEDIFVTIQYVDATNNLTSILEVPIEGI